MRVLHIQDHSIPQMSGYAFRSRYVVATQRELGVDARVLTSARHREFVSLEEELDGIPFFRTPWPRGPLHSLQLRVPFWRERVLIAAMARRILDVAKRFNPQVLHAHSPIFNGIAALRAGAALGIPVVYEIRAFWEDDAVDKNKFREGSFVYRQVRRTETGICRDAGHVITICDGLRADLVGRGIPEARVLVVPNGVDASRFEPKPPSPALSSRLGLDGKVVAGFIGSFFHYEGLPLLVEAAALLKDSHPELRILLVGGGEDERPTRDRARELGVEDRVIFTGRVPHAEVDDYYAAVEVLVYPRLSRRITELVTPLKPLEGLAMGKAIIGSDVGGIRELLQDCPGRMFPAGSATALAEALSAYLDTPESERQRLREEGRRAVLATRRWKDLVAPVLPIYERMAGVPGALAGRPL